MITPKRVRMPRSRIRRKSKSNHYNINAGIVVKGSLKRELHGKRSRPVPGSKLRINKLSGFMGSIITAANRAEYEAKQAEGFKERYVNDVVKKREEIRKQEGKEEDEIQAEVNVYNAEQISEEELERLAKRFARYQTNKERKHYKAWLAGRSSYVYKGSTFPVLTEAFLKNSKSIKEIVKVGDDGDTNGITNAASAAPAGLSKDNERGVDETVRSDSDHQ